MRTADSAYALPHRETSADHPSRIRRISWQRYRGTANARWKMASCGRSAGHPSVRGNIFGAARSTNNDKRETARRLTNNFGVAFLLKIYEERAFLIHKPPNCLYHAAAMGRSGLMRPFPRRAPLFARPMPWRYFEMRAWPPAAWPLVWLSEGPANCLPRRAMSFKGASKGACRRGNHKVWCRTFVLWRLVHPAVHTFVYDNETCVSRGFAYI
jgi:hypothetical protein